MFLFTHISHHQSDDMLTSLCTGYWLLHWVRTFFTKRLDQTHKEDSFKQTTECLLLFTTYKAEFDMFVNVEEKYRKARYWIDVLFILLALPLFKHFLSLSAPSMAPLSMIFIFFGSYWCSFLSIKSFHTECGPHVGLSTEQVEKQASHCNDKKMVSKRVQELSSDLFFGVFVKVGNSRCQQVDPLKMCNSPVHAMCLFFLSVLLF